MDRSAEEIKAKMKEYSKTPEAMEAMADMLLFMGIVDAPLLYKEAQEELKQERNQMTDDRQAYLNHISQGAKFYMSYDRFIEKRKAGEI